MTITIIITILLLAGIKHLMDRPSQKEQSEINRLRLLLEINETKRRQELKYQEAYKRHQIQENERQRQKYLEIEEEAERQFLIGKSVKKRQLEETEETLPYYPKRPLSNIEQVLYFRMITALPDHVVLAQVQLSRFLGVKQDNDFMEWHNKINRMSADFVVCKKDFSIIAIIELDDSSHDSPSRKIKDKKKDNSIKSAGLVIIRWHVKNLPDIKKIKEDIIGDPENRPTASRL